MNIIITEDANIPAIDLARLAHANGCHIVSRGDDLYIEPKPRLARRKVTLLDEYRRPCSVDLPDGPGAA